ncbi:MAG: class II aldolase/adducin family protein [Gammaproteobacteria bacterium]|nr:class II aldolase/adducin family protein [Gammaproteobacteria bacterium]
MAVHAVDSRNQQLLLQALRVDLAAAHRLAVLHELDEGIDNHFTAMVPGQPQHYLALPFGLHWSEASASNLIVCDAQGKTIAGNGLVELSAHCIHEPVHRLCGAQVVLHTHQPWTLALNMLEDNRLVTASQTAAFFHGRVAYDDHYAGTADDPSEGERLAAVLGDPKGRKHTLFMKNHGVMVTGDTVAQAYRRLYMLERVCKAQVLAMSSGRPLAPLSDKVIAQVQAPVDHDPHSRVERERLFIEAMKRVLDRELPGYAD